MVNFEWESRESSRATEIVGHRVAKEVQLLVSIWTCAKYLIQSHTTFLPLNRRDVVLVDGPLHGYRIGQRVAATGSMFRQRSRMSDVPQGCLYKGWNYLISSVVTQFADLYSLQMIPS